jgi:hypothetical protein
VRFSKIAKDIRWEAAHETEAPWKKVSREVVWHLYHGARTVLVRGGCCADSTRKKVAEAAKAGHADFHADLCDGVMTHCQQEFRLVQARLDSKLMGGEPKQSFKLPDEVKRRHPDFSCDVLYRRRVLPHLSQQLSSPAKAAKSIVSQQHGESLV